MKNKTVDEKKKSTTKDIAKVSDKTPAKEEFARVKVLVKDQNGSKSCELKFTEAEIPLLNKTAGFADYHASETLIGIGMMAAASRASCAEEVADEGNKYLAMMADLSPKDGFEGMLISQMLATFKQAMYYIRDANIEGNRCSSAIQDSITNRGIKLMRLYNYQLETLDKHRNKGRQKMTVEHVHVYKGGQAIVGEVHQGGGATNEK